MHNPEFPSLQDSASTGPDNLSAMSADHEELMAILDAAASEARIATKLEDKISFGPLPAALYHATTRERASAIMRDGLMPSELMEGDKRVVSLSDTVSFALACASVTQQTPAEELVVLEITTKGQPRDAFECFQNITRLEYAKLAGMPHDGLPDGPIHEVHFVDSEGISPDFMYQLAPHEVAEELAAEQR